MLHMHSLQTACFGVSFYFILGTADYDKRSESGRSYVR